MAGSALYDVSAIAEWLCVSLSVVCYRLWIVFEWVRIAQDTLTGKNNTAATVMICVFATVASVVGVTLSSRLDRLLVR